MFIACASWWFAAAAQDIEFTVESFIVEGDNPLGASVTNAVLAPFVGNGRGLDDLREAAEALERRIQTGGQPFHRVVLPAQTVADGVVRLHVYAFTVGDIVVEGNQFHSDENILASLPALVPGQSPDAGAVSRNLALANLNASKRARLTFGPGQRAGLLDARVEVADRDPRRYYLWANDTGTDETGNYRVGAGFHHANFLGRDQYLSGTVSTSPSRPDQVSQFGLSWRAPLYRYNALVNVFAVDSDVDSGTVAEFFDVRGSGTVLGAGVSKVLPRAGDVRQALTLGITDKLFDNDVDFADQPIGVDVRTRPLYLDYRGEFESDRSRGNFSVTALTNLSGGSDNDQASYTAARAGADQDWQALRADFHGERDFDRWMTRGRVSAQYASEPLVSGEQFGVGGSAGVRGFDEREFAADRGINASLEVFGPSLPRGLRLGWFLDGAVLENSEPVVGEIDRLDLLSTGLTANWQVSRQLELHVDFAHVLNVSGFTPEGSTQEDDERVHFNVTYYSD